MCVSTPVLTPPTATSWTGQQQPNLLEPGSAPLVAQEGTSPGLPTASPSSLPEEKGSSVPPPLGFKKGRNLSPESTWGRHPHAISSRSWMKASNTSTMALSSALLPSSAQATTTRDQLSRHMALKIKSQLMWEDMQRNQTQKNKNRGCRFHQGFGKCNAVQLAEFLSYSKRLPQPHSHQPAPDGGSFMYWLFCFAVTAG